MNLGCKILLYEPEKEGHREIYVHYISSALKAAGFYCEYVFDLVHTSFGRLTQEAVSRGAQYIFVCTFDGKFPRIVAEATYARMRGVRMMGIYYLYNNVYAGWKGFVWHKLLYAGVVHRLFVMDPFLEPLPVGVKRWISVLPDTYERAIFQPRDNRASRVRLGLAEDTCVFLAFGALDARKGIDVLAAAVATWSWERFPNVQFLFAGKASREVNLRLQELQRQNHGRPNAVVVIAEHIPEEDVSAYYSAASYLVAPYPRWFAVSSGAITRAFAAGIPVITGAHGVNGRMVFQKGAGIVFGSSSVSNLRNALEAGAHTYIETRPRWLEMGRSAAAEGERRELRYFFAAMKAGLAAAAKPF